MFNKQKLASTAKEKERWEKETLRRTLERFPERLKEFATVSGRPIKRLYTPMDVEDLDYMRDLGFPGEIPFTRGIYPTQYRGRLWTMRQYAGFATAEETNKRYKYLLEQGQTGLSVAFDLPTQIGYDSDNPASEGEVGKVGVPISSLKDMEVLFDEIPLGKVSTSMTINSTAPQVLAMYFALAERQGVPLKNVRGTVQNDILKEYVARGTYIYPPEPSMKLVVDIIEYCFKNTLSFNAISVSGYHMREAGATAVQELAFTLANGIAYIDAVMKRGLHVGDFAPRVSFFFACHNDFFEEIAKFRAARRLWAQIMKERFKAKGRSLLMRYHVQTDGVTLTAQQPYNNIVRVTIQALAAVLGGTQSLHTNSFDEALALPSEVAVTTALRTQQIIAHESGVTNTIDPLGGAYMVEYLTNKIEEEAMEYIKKIDEMGGATAAIGKGFYQREIVDSAYRQQKEIDGKRRILVGVNEFIGEETEVPIKLLKVDPVAEKRQIERLRRVRAERDGRKVKDVLEKLRKAAEGHENLMPFMFEAIKAYATNGEISDILRKAYGEYKATTIV